MFEPTYCLMKPATGRVNIELDCFKFTTEFMNESGFDCRSKPFVIAPTEGPKSNESIWAMCRNRTDGVLIPLEDALLPGYRMSTMVSSI